MSGAKKRSLISEDTMRRRQQRTEKVTRVVALVFAFFSVFFFLIKLLFL
jgi:uncharacterized membrane protein